MAGIHPLQTGPSHHARKCQGENREARQENGCQHQTGWERRHWLQRFAQLCPDSVSELRRDLDGQGAVQSRVVAAQECDDVTEQAIALDQQEVEWAQRRSRVRVSDIGLPDLNGVEITAEILRAHPAAKVVILSMFDDEHSVVTAVRSGARGFVLKRASDTDLLEALRIVAGGGMYLSPQVSDRLLQRIQTGNLDAAPLPPALGGLSPREVQVLRLVADGKTSKEIGSLLDLTEQTVRSYRKTMMKKLGVNNVASLTQLALNNGLTQVARAHHHS